MGLHFRGQPASGNALKNIVVEKERGTPFSSRCPALCEVRVTCAWCPRKKYSKPTRGCARAKLSLCLLQRKKRIQTMGSKGPHWELTRQCNAAFEYATFPLFSPACISGFLSHFARCDCTIFVRLFCKERPRRLKLNCTGLVDGGEDIGCTNNAAV